MSTFKPASIGKTGILSIKKNGEQVSRYRPDLDDAEIDISSAEKITTTGKFTTINGGKLESCIVDLEPIQDLHGYNNPWVGGSGKNKLPMTVSGIKSINTSGTWSGNEYTFNGVKFTVNTDEDENVTSIKVTGTASALSYLYFQKNSESDYSVFAGKSCILNGCPANGSTSTYVLGTYGSGMTVNDVGNGVNITFPSTEPSSWNVTITIIGGYAIPTGGLTFYPMLRLSTVSDATFEPYTNICGIEGHTAVEVKTSGFNLWDEQWETGQYDLTTGQKINPTGVTTKRSVNYIKVEPSTTYFLHSNVNVRLFRYTTDKTYIDTVVVNKDTEFTTSSTTGYITFQCDVSMTYVCINVSDESKNGQYIPYQGQDITVSLGGTYYGGTLDVVTGKFTGYVVGAEFDGSNDENWSFTDSAHIAYIELSPSAKYMQTPVANWLNGQYSESYVDLNDGEFAFPVNPSVQNFINIRVDSIANLSAWRTFLASNHLQICYELETPTVIQLTPQQINTLIGENNIDIPLTGQTLTSAIYRELFAWDDVTDVVESKAQYYEQNQYLGINLFDILEQGTIKSVDGTPTDGTNRCRTNDYVDVIEGTRILINKPTTVKLALYRYDASKNFIDWFNDFWAQNTEAVNYEYVIPSGTKYIKMVVAYASEVDCVPSDFAGYTLLNVKSNAQLDITKQICKQFYGTCSTAADTVAKVVTVSSDQNFVLTTGCVVYVKFTNTNSASNITLDVNGSGAKSITYAGDTVVTGSSGVYTGTANYTNQYMYDGTYWKWMGYSNEKDTTYSSMSLDEMRAGTATSNRSIRADRLATVTEERIDAKLTEKLYKSGSFTSSTSASTTVTATNSAISISSTTPIDVYSDVFGLNVEAMSVSGSGTSATISITFPKTESAQTINYRVYVKTI